jgi:hypothetical protein
MKVAVPPLCAASSGTSSFKLRIYPARPEKQWSIEEPSICAIALAVVSSIGAFPRPRPVVFGSQVFGTTFATVDCFTMRNALQFAGTMTMSLIVTSIAASCNKVLCSSYTTCFQQRTTPLSFVQN